MLGGACTKSIAIVTAWGAVVKRIMLVRQLIKLGRSKNVWSLSLICSIPVFVLYLHTHVTPTLPSVAEGKTEWNERKEVESILSDQKRNDDGVLTASSYLTRGEGYRDRQLLDLPDTRQPLASVPQEPEDKANTPPRRPLSPRDHDGHPTAEESLSGVLKETQYNTVSSGQPGKMERWNQVASGLDQRRKGEDDQLLSSEDYLPHAEGDKTRLLPILPATQPRYDSQQVTKAPWSDASTNIQPSASSYSTAASSSYCNAAGIKSWRSEVITQLEPPVEKNCGLLQSGNRNEISRVKSALKSWSNSESEQQWIQRMGNCSTVIEEFSNNFYISQEEINFPLAYIFIVYTNARQVVRLLKAIYRPHNVYCIHPDARQGEEFARVFRQISKCLDNVFVASKLINVYYQHHTIMDSQLICMEDLLKYEPQRWKYVINLCGRELPLKTNREIVSSLKRLKGTSAVDSVLLGRKAHMWEDRFTHKIALNYTSGHIYYTSQKAGRPPHHIKIYKSFNFIAATRPFVDFILHSRKAIDFRNYLKELKIPEEHFYASLSRLPEAPGATLKSGNTAVPVVDQYIWLNSVGQPRKYHQVCEGKAVHFICILTVGDLPEIYRLGVNNPRPHFFFNKYFMEDDHVVMDCMEERLVKQNKLEYKQDCG